LTSDPTEASAIQNITYTSEPRSAEIRARLTLVENTNINKINVISDGDLFHSTRLATGETKAWIPIAGTSAYNGYDSISKENTEIVLIGDGSETTVPLTYKPEVQFKRIVPADEHEDLRSHRSDVGLLLENPTDKPALIRHYRHDNGGGAVSDGVSDPLPLRQKIVPKNSEFLARCRRLLSVRLCEDISGETHETTVSFSMLFADNLGVKIPVEYEQQNKRDGCQTSIAGEAKMAPPMTETPTETGQR
jgi:hypothetical protein